MKVLLNGKIIDRKDAKVDIEDRGYQFGDGIYEAIRVYQGQLFTFQEHMQRLYRSAEKIDLTIPYTQEMFEAWFTELIAKNQLETGMIYFQVSRGVQAPRNHIYQESLTPAIMATTMAAPRDLFEHRKGIKTITVPDTRWLHCDIKSLNLLGNLMATNQAAKAGAKEAIFYRSPDTVTECSHSNVSIIKEGVLITHPANEYILNGITRQVILSLAKQLSIPFEERPFTLAELKAADEVFISSISAEVTAVGQVDEVTIGNGKIGPVSEKILTAFTNEIEKNCGITLRSTAK
ncbi:D-amino-acid transaminase [Enterococcus italicus]